MTKPENIIPFLVPGRLIYIKTDKEDWGWGVLVSFSKQKITAKSKDQFRGGHKAGNLADIK